MRVLGLVLMVGLVGCGGARRGGGDPATEPRERERGDEGEYWNEHHVPPEDGESPRVVRPEMVDPVAVGPALVFADAQEAYRQGQTDYNLGRYDDAIRDFSAAFQLMSHPAFLYNIAQAHRLRGDLKRAIFFYRAFLRLEPTSSQAAAIQQRVRELEDELAGRVPEYEPPVG